MAYTEAGRKATDKWQKENYEFIKVRFAKGEKERVRELAESAGKSVNQYIRDSVLRQ